MPDISNPPHPVRGLLRVGLVSCAALGLGSTTFAAPPPSAPPTSNPPSSGAAAIAATGIPASLTADLNILAAPSGTYPAATVDAAVNNARAVFESFAGESDAAWADYFTAYLRQVQIPDHFYGFLSGEALRVGSEGKRDRLQYALYTAATRNIRSMVDGITDWKVSFSDQRGFVQNINMLNYFVYDMTMKPGVYRNYKNSTLDLYDYLYSKYPTYLKKYEHFYDVAYGYLNNFKEMNMATMASLGRTDPALRQRAKLIIGLDKVASPYETRIFDTYSLVVQDNGGLIDNQFKLMFDLMQTFPADYNKTAQIAVPYPSRNILHGAQSTGSFSIVEARIGDYGGNQVSDGLEPDDFDYFISLFTHEYMHQIDNNALNKFPYLRAQKNQIIKTAGLDKDNYIRIIEDGFYFYSPQEFIAGNSNNYMAHTRRTFNHVMKRFYESGRTTPIDTFLLLANIMSNGTNVAMGFEYGAGANTKFTVTNLPVEKNAAGFITKINFGPCETYEFVLNAQNMVADVIAPKPTPAGATPGTCVDLDNDNDGITDIDEGFQSAILDFGHWGDISGNQTVSMAQPGSPAPTQTKVTLSSSGPDQQVLLRQVMPWGSRDESGVGSGILFRGNYFGDRYAEVGVDFGAPVNDLTFDVTDLAVEATAGDPSKVENLEIHAYRAGKEVPLDYRNLRTLTADQARPKLSNNTLTGEGAGSANTQRVTFVQPVDRLVLRAVGRGAAAAPALFGVFNLRWSGDFDGDGTPNNLDADSDGDSCPDATEGDKSIARTALDQSWMVVGGIDATGVPLLAGGGQGLGTSQNSARQGAACALVNPPTALITIPTAPAVKDDPATKGDASYVIPPNTDTLVWVRNEDGSLTANVASATTRFPDGTAALTFPAPVDVFTGVVTTTTPTTTTAPTTTTVPTTTTAPKVPTTAPTTTPTTKAPATTPSTLKPATSPATTVAATTTTKPATTSATTTLATTVPTTAAAAPTTTKATTTTSVPLATNLPKTGGGFGWLNAAVTFVLLGGVLMVSSGRRFPARRPR